MKRIRRGRMESRGREVKGGGNRGGKWKLNMCFWWWVRLMLMLVREGVMGWEKVIEGVVRGIFWEEGMEGVGWRKG